MSKRADGIEALRSHAQAMAAVDVHKAHMDLIKATKQLLNEFRMQFNPPGARYWEAYSDHKPPMRMHFTSIYSEDDGTSRPRDWVVAELTHNEYLGRQGIHGDYDPEEEEL